MKEEHPKSAPTGQWKMPETEIRTALGHFIMGWAGLEAVLEISIAKQLGLEALEASIVTSSIQFKGRCAILLSLLNRNPGKYERGINAVKQIQNICDRNDILHSVMGGSESIIWFNRRKTTNKFTSKIERYDSRRLNLLALKCGDLAGELMECLSISKDNYTSFFQEAHNRANNV
ncbi:hypothetical protein [Tistlia consotensis]|uniref:hypothetical protein n=1 Tax=Tistlia consotensis TaxID=1321365 RepID=UPI001180F1F9|nr:hypothetical protein [Tistlia consotensis]